MVILEDIANRSASKWNGISFAKIVFLVFYGNIADNIRMYNTSYTEDEIKKQLEIFLQMIFI